MLRLARPAEIERENLFEFAQIFFATFLLYTLYYATCAADLWYVWIA